MTVQVSDRLSQLYVGNGINTRFDFTFRAFEQEDETGIGVRVKVGNDFEFIDESEYAVTLNPDNLGGYVTFVEPPSAVTFFYIAGKTPVDQLLDITNYDNFYPDAIERALDKLTAILQEWKHLVDFETQARILADIDYDELAKQREADLKSYIDGIASSIIGQPIRGLPATFVVDGDENQKQINDQVKAKLGHFKLLQDYITPDMTDHTQAILLAISENDFLDFGTVENTYYVSQPISLRSGMTIISNGAKFIGKLGIQGAAPYTARGIIDARNLVDTNMYGVVQTFIDHTEFSSLGDATNKPTIIGFLGDACTDCDFGLFDSVGSVNYCYAPNFKEYGIVDLRNSTDCIVRHKVDGRYKQETVSSTPSTVGVFGINNTRCISIGSAKNTYWSGILWGGIDCKIISPVVRNTKGSNINLGGINTNAYNVDLKTSEQGNVSIGEGTDTCYSCSVFGGTIGDAQYANVALHNSAQNCKVFADIYGWGQIKGTADVSKVGVRVRGKGNTITVSAKKVRDGYTAFGDACNVHSTTLVNPDVDGNIIKIVSEGAGVSVRAPNTVIDVDVTNATTVNALYMGYRCAGSEVKRVRAKNCLRPFVYEPDTATPADYANVYVGSIISIGCVDESVTPLMNYRRSGRARDVIESMSSSLGLNDVLYALDAYSHDSSITGTNKLAAAILLLCTDAFGTSYGADILTSTLSAGVLVNKAHKFRIGSFEIEAVSGSASSLICVSPDGTRYKLQPANGGGAATWVVAT